MASEDSQDLGWFPMIHRLNDLRNLNDAWHRKVPTELHQLDNSAELLEVIPFRSSKWVLLEEWDDLRTEILESIDVVPEEVLTVIVSSSIPINLAASEEAHQLLQCITARLSLHDVERRSHLPFESHLVTSVDGAAEAAFSIHEAHDPSDGRESFLLVFRTCRVVTARHNRSVTTGYDIAGRVAQDAPGFPAYSRLRTARSPARGAAPPACLGASYLRTVIVTAAVYWRLDSGLRYHPKAEPNPSS